jgi:hypothetical protein
MRFFEQRFGDHIQQALAAVGLTDGLVSSWLGRPCGCKERQGKLNALDSWARRIASGRIAQAEEYLKKLMT